MVSDPAKAAIAFSMRLVLAAALGVVAGAAAAEETHTVTARAIQDRKAVFATVESRDVAVARARVGGIIREGGTVLGSARCPEFLDRKTRDRAWLGTAKVPITCPSAF